MQSSVYILYYLSMLFKTYFIRVWTYVQCTTDSTDSISEKRNRKTKIDFVHRSYIFCSEFRIERFCFHYFFLFISHWSLISFVIRRARIHFYFIIIAMIEDWGPWIQLNWKCTVSSTLCTVHSSSITYCGLKKKIQKPWFVLCMNCVVGCDNTSLEPWVLSLKGYITLHYYLLKFSMDYLNLMQILFHTKQRTNEG